MTAATARAAPRDHRGSRADRVADDRGVRRHAAPAPGLVTNVPVSVVGVVALRGGRGRLVPRGAAARARRGGAGRAGPPRRRAVAACRRSGSPRARRGTALGCRVEIYPYSAGVKGGIAGGVAMAVLAVLYGLARPRQRLVPDQPARGAPARRRSATRPPRCCAPSTRRASSWRSSSTRRCRSWSACSTACCCRWSRGIRRFSGGVVAPLLWTRAHRASLDVVNPALERAHRLAVVRGLADRVRPRRGPRGRALGADRRPSSTCRSRCVRASRAQDAPMRFRVLAAAGIVAALRGRLRPPARPAARRRPPAAAVAGDGLRDALRRELRRLPRRGRAPGAAVALADPVYLAFVDDATLPARDGRGVPGTAMPAFARAPAARSPTSRSTSWSAACARAGRGAARSAASRRRPTRAAPATRAAARSRTPPAAPACHGRGRGTATQAARSSTVRTWRW